MGVGRSPGREKSEKKNTLALTPELQILHRHKQEKIVQSKKDVGGERELPCARLVWSTYIRSHILCFVSFTSLIFPPLNYEHKPSLIYLSILTAHHIVV